MRSPIPAIFIMLEVSFTRGFYNLIYSRGESYIVSDTGELFKETQEGIMSANMNIEDIE